MRTEHNYIETNGIRFLKEKKKKKRMELGLPRSINMKKREPKVLQHNISHRQVWSFSLKIQTILSQLSTELLEIRHFMYHVS